jgi:hypothetical protein
LWFLGIRITLVDMAGRKRNKRPSEPKPRSQPKTREDRQNRLVDELAEVLRREVDKTLGPSATYEQRRDLEAELMRKILWKREDDDLQEFATNAEEVEIGDKRYRRLRQRSSATYHGRWGPHTIVEPLYREIGVHNGPTIKPLELRVGIVAKRLTPDLARIAGELNADENSRQLARILTIVGMRPPSRAVLEKRVKLMSEDVAEHVEELETASRAKEQIPDDVASISCGLDRFSVRMAEPASTETIDTRSPPRRTTPYVRTPPPPKEHHWRKAWVGSVSLYDRAGKVSMVIQERGFLGDSRGTASALQRPDGPVWPSPPIRTGSPAKSRVAWSTSEASLPLSSRASPCDAPTECPDFRAFR